MEVPDQGNIAAQGVQALTNRRHRSGRLGRIDRHAHELGTGVGKRLDLSDRCIDIGGIGVCHRLHDDRRASADDDAVHMDRPRAPTVDGLAV